jgi:hydrogenase nickel incorporation protein HypA/HybF
MHELALMDDLVHTVMQELGDTRVHRVRLILGRESCALPDALRFCFDICVDGTPLEGAALDIVETSGNELMVKEVEVS